MQLNFPDAYCDAGKMKKPRFKSQAAGAVVFLADQLKQ